MSTPRSLTHKDAAECTKAAALLVVQKMPDQDEDDDINDDGRLGGQYTKIMPATFRKRRLSLKDLLTGDEWQQQQQQRRPPPNESKGSSSLAVSYNDAPPPSSSSLSCARADAVVVGDTDEQQGRTAPFALDTTVTASTIRSTLTTMLQPGLLMLDEKAHTFRKRRLSLTQNHLFVATSADDNSETNSSAAPATAAASSALDIIGSSGHPISSDSKSSMPIAMGPCTVPDAASLANAVHGTLHTRKLQGSQLQQHDGTVSTTTTNQVVGEGLVSRTIHASELTGTDTGQPHMADNILYNTRLVPPPPPTPSQPDNYHQGGSGDFSGSRSLTNDSVGWPLFGDPDFHPSDPMKSTTTAAGSDPACMLQQQAANAHYYRHQLQHRHQPQWKMRKTIRQVGEDHKLPFPRTVVGTYSCHGMEPVYDAIATAYDNNWNSQLDPLQQLLVLDGLLTSSSPSPATTHHLAAAKINQDRGGIAFPYGNSPRTALFAVYDGHGRGGELVSQFALHEIQQRLEQHPQFSTDLPRALRETFVHVDRALSREPLIEPLFAGTTACVIVLQDRTLTVANVGDSRAVLARRTTDHRHDSATTTTNTHLSTGSSLVNWEAIQLTQDQNPDVPEEMRRIILSGGYVSPSPGPGLSARVWLDPHCTQVGLAMARSLGDHAVSAVGVIADPVVTTYQVDPNNDEFVIVASDGVWEFVTSQQAVQIVGAHLLSASTTCSSEQDRTGGDATKACQALIEAAATRWHEEEGEYRDDITAIVVRLRDLWESVGTG